MEMLLTFDLALQRPLRVLAAHTRPQFIARPLFCAIQSRLRPHLFAADGY